MENQTGSCWGLTTKVLLGVAGLMLVAWLAGGSEGSALLASAAG